MVLKPSTMRFEPGQLTFVVGRSGSGKSTLGNLLVRFYEPLAGQITVDGNSIKTLDLDWFRRNVTLIQQSSVLFSDTFFHNVSLGASDPNTVSQDIILKACSMALLQSTISGMPDGGNTVIGPGGYNLSGGQKQRLALARAKLRDPPVLILDEITSGLDPASRTLIMEAIRIWRKDKTTIIITHEVGHIEDDEYVYVLADGSVVQQGFKRNLAAESGLFATFVACADDSSPSSSASSDAESDISDYEPAHEAQFAKVLRGALVDYRIMSVGLFRRISIRVDPSLDSASHKAVVNRATSHSLHRSPSRRPGINQSASGMLSRTPNIKVMTQRGLHAQKSRNPNARLVQQESGAERQPSLDALETFFLENLAKRKDRKKPPKGRPLPSLTAILKTVWPTLDKIGKAQLVLGIALCLVIAGSNPVFSFFFANLIGGFWVVEGQENSTSKWTGLLALIAVVDLSLIHI